MRTRESSRAAHPRELAIFEGIQVGSHPPRRLRARRLALSNVQPFRPPRSSPYPTAQEWRRPHFRSGSLRQARPAETRVAPQPGRPILPRRETPEALESGRNLWTFRTPSRAHASSTRPEVVRGRQSGHPELSRVLPAALCPALAWCFTPRGRSGATKRPKALGCQLLAQGPPRGHLPGRSTVKPGPHPRARQPGQPGQAPDQRRQHREHVAPSGPVSRRSRSPSRSGAAIAAIAATNPPRAAPTPPLRS